MNDFTDQITKLDNGVTIVTRQMPEKPAVAFQIVVRAGSFAERKEESGWAHWTEHMLGGQPSATESGKPPKLAFEDLGFGGFDIAINHFDMLCPSFGNDGAPFYFSTHAFPEAFDICLNMIGSPVFSSDTINRERPAILEEFNSFKKNYERRKHLKQTEMFFPGSNRARLGLGTEESVKSFSKENAMHYWKRTFMGSRTFVFAAGVLDHDKIVERVNLALGSLFPGRPYAPEKLSHAPGIVRLPYGILEPDTLFNRFLAACGDFYFQHPRLAKYMPLASIFPTLSQQHDLTLIWPGATLDDPKRPIMEAAAYILGKALRGALRHKANESDKTIYAANAYSLCLTDYGQFCVTASFDEKKTAFVLETIRQQMDALTIKPSGDFLSTWKLERKNQWDIYAPTAFDQALRLRDEYLAYGRLLDNKEILDNQLNVSLADVACTARDIFEKPLSLVVTGPAHRFPDRKDVEALLTGKNVKTPSRSAQSTP